jgi:hypothetical protein
VTDIIIGRIQSLQELCGSENPDVITALNAGRSFSTEICVQGIIAENE